MYIIWIFSIFFFYFLSQQITISHKFDTNKFYFHNLIYIIYIKYIFEQSIKILIREI